ncbi:hypothetical protein ACFX1Z_042954 [Malus domestica]
MRVVLLLARGISIRFSWNHIPKLVISSLVAGLECIPWEILPTLSRVLELGRSFQACTWSWVPRLANVVADFVASHSVVGMCNSLWVTRPLSSLVGILNKDGIPWPPQRL